MPHPLQSLMSAPALLLAGSLVLMPGCSKEPDEPEVAQVEHSADSLDELLTPDQRAAAEAAEADAVVVIDQTEAPAESDGETEEDREWVRERESQSTLGRTRDRAKELRNQIQGGTEAEEGLASVTSDEEWVGSDGLVWDMPEDWRMAVPASGRFGEMLIPSDYGAASVTFTREAKSRSEIERRIGSMLVDPIGSRIRPRKRAIEAAGWTVDIFEAEGTYIDPSAKGGKNEIPFYAMRAAVVEVEGAHLVVKMWGPETTIEHNQAKFIAMIENMRED